MYDATRSTSDEDSDGTDLLTLAARLTKQVRFLTSFHFPRNASIPFSPSAP